MSHDWYRDAVFYELRVASFCDGDGDGSGDFRGLTSKLGYLHDLGVTTLWLLPFYPSPLRDDGYDISDYLAVHPACGTLDDFRRFLDEAHRRDLRVVTELVLNHTSDQHAWFRRARASPPGTSARDFYVWSDRPDRYAGARIIFRDAERSNWAWDPVAGAYYWHRFFSHQPDLNFDHPPVRAAMLEVLDFWLGLGVDGLRLDAVPYLFERDGTSSENLPETHDFLRQVRRHVDQNHPDRMLLAEANQWPEDAVAYFGQGDECHMAFHFPIMPRLFMAIRTEDRFPILDVLAETPPLPPGGQWALFLRNHDELTLEMVTEEERDYMHRVYARDPRMMLNLGIRRRLAPLLGNNRRAIELLNALLFSLPGTPVLYYGDEIGMGDNVYLGDRNGVRTPMQWSADRNAGFSRANPQRMALPIIIDPEYHYESINVEVQQNNPASLLWWTTRLIALRRHHPGFGRGTIELLAPRNRKVLAFLRRHEDETLLVLANLSRFAQYAEVDLAAFAGSVPVELFGRTPFPAIAETPYLFTLGPHAFLWFALEGRSARSAGAVDAPLRVAPGPAGITGLLAGDGANRLVPILPALLRSRDWFQALVRTVRAATLADVAPLTPACSLLFVRAELVDREAETYLLPVVVTSGAVPASRLADVLAEVGSAAPGDVGYLLDGVADPGCAAELLGAIAAGRRQPTQHGEIQAWTTPRFDQLRIGEPAPLARGHARSSIFFSGRYYLRIVRRIEPGPHPAIEVAAYLEARGFTAAPPLLGAIEYRRGEAEPAIAAVLEGHVASEGDLRAFTVDALGRYLDRVLSLPAPRTLAALPLPGRLAPGAGSPLPPEVGDLLGAYPRIADQLGRRTAELHHVLGGETSDPAFAPEPFTRLDQHSLYQSMRGRLLRLVDRLGATGAAGPAAAVSQLLAATGGALGRIQTMRSHPIGGQRIRVHGDLGLERVLHTGRDVVFVGFGADSTTTLGEKRIKRHPLRDVAATLVSLHRTALGEIPASARDLGLDPAVSAAAADFWRRWVAAVYLRSYLATAAGAAFLPAEPDEVDRLLDLFAIERAMVEVDRALDLRPDRLEAALACLRERVTNP